ncbi:MAG: hypothetical protein H6736_00695 [Alphaproteobacteria bacterium]|nr:hypothetical protein [Alphaproteobacteria bacterium]MCB9690308.1 hypothetical protein [Alphaproteobacteria bacterium]
MILTLSVALATNYSMELAVPSEHPAWLDAATVFGAHRIVAQTSHADLTVASTHPNVECAIQDGYVTARMYANKANYPTSFPFDATCAYGGDSLKVTVVTFSAATDPALQPNIIDENGAVSLTRVTGSHAIESYRLPECERSYETGTYTSSLKFVYCVVEKWDDFYTLRLHVPANASMGTGSCSLPTDGGPPEVISITLAEAPI